WKNTSLVRTYLDGIRGGIPFGMEQLEVMLRVIEARAEPITRFADLGCGGGAVASAVLGRYPQAHATLIDFSEPMLADARARLDTREPRPRFIVADLASPTWVGALAEAARFDAVVSGYAIHHLPDTRKRELYAEIFALLAPGAMFVNVEHVASRT